MYSRRSCHYIRGGFKQKTCSPHIPFHPHPAQFLHRPSFTVIYWESSLSLDRGNGREKQRKKMEKTRSNGSEENPLGLQPSPLHPQEAISYDK